MESLLCDYASAVERALAEFIALEPETPVLSEALRYALGLDSAQPGHRGKRFRAALCLLVSETLGVSQDRALPLALAVELLHQFLLVHDDLEDGDTARRNRPTVWVRYGVAHATNVGDFLGAKAWEALCRLSRNGCRNGTVVQLVGLLNNTLLRLGRGQARDLASVARHDVGLAEYESIAQQKTGSCWTFTLLGAAIIAEAATPIREGISRYANAIGVTYQIVDDVLDLTVAKGRTRVGCDVRHGRRTWPIIFAAGQCAADEQQHLFEILDRPPDETQEEDVRWILDLLQSYDAIGAAQRRIHQREKEALDAIGDLSEPLRARLRSVWRFLARRQV